VSRAPSWLDAINYRPRHISVRIGSNPELSWYVRADFALYRLFRRVQAGYSASSVDLETFFGLRFACERLGSARSGTSDLLVRDLQEGRLYHLRERTVLGKQTLQLTQRDDVGHS
jgi:hypothetical protein